MKYFIDFEFYQSPVFRISSVGCIDENGREFYSLVRQNDNEIDDNYCKSRMIRRIDFLLAPGLNEVFVNLYRWINHDDDVEIYCYGGADFTFVDYALKENLSFESNCMLSFLKHKMMDYSVNVSYYFHTKSKIALIKIVSYFRGYEVKQLHNALEDAKFLKEVFEYTQKVKPPVENPFITNEFSMLVAFSSTKRYYFDSFNIIIK